MLFLFVFPLPSLGSFASIVILFLVPFLAPSLVPELVFFLEIPLFPFLIP